jgi:hypothetical protein
MADYVPVFSPGEDITQTAGAAITAGQLVSLSAANTVVPTAAATAAWLGVATTDAANGAKVGITCGGVQEVKCSAAVAVGDVVIPASTGRVAPIGAGTNYAQQVGVAMTSTSAADQTLHVKFTR